MFLEGESPALTFWNARGGKGQRHCSLNIETNQVIYSTWWEHWSFMRKLQYQRNFNRLFTTLSGYLLLTGGEGRFSNFLITSWKINILSSLHCKVLAESTRLCLSVSSLSVSPSYFPYRLAYPAKQIFLLSPIA